MEREREANQIIDRSTTHDITTKPEIKAAEQEDRQPLECNITFATGPLKLLAYVTLGKASLSARKKPKGLPKSEKIT